MCASFYLRCKVKKEYFQKLFRLAEKAFDENEVPVSAIIVKNDKIIGSGRNQQNKTNKISKHAEINAIENAIARGHKYELSDAILYVSLEPCLMCLGAIIEAQIKKVVYVLDSPKDGCLKYVNQEKILRKVKIEKTEFTNPYGELLKNFFIDKR